MTRSLTFHAAPTISTSTHVNTNSLYKYSYLNRNEGKKKAMSKPVEQALVGLVPAHNGPLPSELLSVAVSLLAQSRSKASSLRPEEEIARTYACAHLACER